MQRARNLKGYTLVELLVTMAVIAVLAAIALPMYGSQMDSAKLVKTRKHFDDATRIAQQEFLKDRQLEGMGQLGSLPADAAAWIKRFDADTGAVAPGGGAAFIVGTLGDPVTGAIGVAWDNTAEVLTLTRPTYVDEAGLSITISVEGSSIVQ